MARRIVVLKGVEVLLSIDFSPLVHRSNTKRMRWREITTPDKMR
jgi:hypothetical protein